MADLWYRRLPGGVTRWRITATATLTAAVVFGIASAVSYQTVRDQQEQATSGRANSEVGSIRAQLLAGVVPDTYAGEFPFEIVVGDGSILTSQFAIQPYERDGPVAPAPGLTSDDFSGQEDARDPNSFASVTTSVTLDTPYSTTGLNGLTLPVIYADIPAAYIPITTIAPDAWVRVAVFVTPFGIDEALAQVRTPFLIGIPLLLVVIALVVWWSVGRALRPVAAIRGRMVTITGENLDARVPEPATRDEVEQLARSVNETLDRLAAADRRQRAFVSDAAHELRSPIAALRSTLDVADAYPGHADPAHTAAAVRRQVVRLAVLSENLLQLAVLDRPLTDRRPFDIVSVVEETLDASAVPVVWSPPAFRRTCTGDPVEMGRAVGNVVANAGRHARSTVTVRVVPQHAGVSIIVGNDGPSIADPDLDRIFERLVRLDEARALDAGGSGLGLAITRRVVERHGGRVWAENRSDGVAFIVELPTVEVGPVVP